MKRIAFLGRGVHTIPTYRQMLNRLSGNFDITVFCETPIEQTWRSYERKYKLVSACIRFLPFRVNTILFFISVLWHHLFRRYDVIHAHSTFPTGLTAVILQRIFGVPTVVSLDGGEGVGVNGVAFGDLTSRRRTSINKWALNRTSVVTTLTNFHRALIERNLGLSRKILVIPRGVDQDQFPIKKDLSVQNPVRFLSVGYLSPIKDPVTLLKTFQIILKEGVQATLTIVGKDYMNGEVQKLAVDLGVESSIQFVDHVDHEAMASIYADADILLHTSRYESQGMVVAEAMACGVLVCGTHVGLINDLADECCLSAPVGDAGTLAKRVIDLMIDQKWISALQAKAKIWTSNFSQEKTAARWSDIYAALIEKRK